MSERLVVLREVLRRTGCSPADAIALAVLALASLSAVGVMLLAGRPVAGPGDPSSVVAAPTDTASDASGLGIDGADVIVHVAGAVASPGVYTLPAGSRVGDAVTAAGGPKPRAVLDGLNLARTLTDGEQVLVADRRTAADAPAQPGAVAPGGATPAATVNLNQADAATLETLPGIGPVLAERIVQHRDSVGGFKSVGDLRDVTGIGEKTFQAVVDLVTL